MALWPARCRGGLSRGVDAGVVGGPTSVGAVHPVWARGRGHPNGSSAGSVDVGIRRLRAPSTLQAGAGGRALPTRWRRAFRIFWRSFWTPGCAALGFPRQDRHRCAGFCRDERDDRARRRPSPHSHLRPARIRGAADRHRWLRGRRTGARGYAGRVRGRDRRPTLSAQGHDDGNPAAYRRIVDCHRSFAGRRAAVADVRSS